MKQWSPGGPVRWWVAGWLGLLGAMAPAVAATAPVTGFIVQLRDAPSHAQLARAGTASAQGLGARRQALRQRWQGLLGATGLAGQTGLRLQPVGEAAQRLSWGRTLTRQEQSLWQARLAARADVAWVVPDSVEPRLQAVAPDDPLFPGLDQQWWLQPVAGSNSAALTARLRGVPGMQTAWARGTGSGAPVVAVLDTGLTTHPDLDSSRLLPGFDLVSDWDSSTARGYANDGDGRDADPSDPGDWVSAADQQADADRYGSCRVQASSWHGTTVTGQLVAATGNALGVAGLTRDARILPVRVAGKCGATVSDIVDGMRWAAGLTVCQVWRDSQDPSAGCSQWAPVNPTPARIINISFGGASECNAAYQAAIDEVWGLGVLVVAAAGNDHAAPARPANCNHVLGVAALNRDGFKASYSNYGSALQLATVGGDDSSGRWGSLLTDGGLLTLANDGADAPGLAQYGRHTGTSFAAPVVAGVAAQMLSLAPSLDAQGLWRGLQASARPHVQSSLMSACSADNPGRCLCTTATCGAGILDADEALRYAQLAAAGQTYQAPSWPTVQIDTAELREAVALGPDREAASSSGDDSGGSGGGGGGLDALVLAGLLAAGLALGRVRAPRRSPASAPSRPRPR